MYYNVQPLKTNEEINDFLQALGLIKFGERNQYLFLLGINTGLRIGDILELRISDLISKNPVIKEQKTGKRRFLYLENLNDETQKYVHGKNIHAFAFQSRSGQKLTTNAVYKIFQKAAWLLERDDIGTHTMRKTFGYHYYKKTKDIATLMKIFNHSSEKITKRYFGIDDEEIRIALCNFYLGYTNDNITNR